MLTTIHLRLTVAVIAGVLVAAAPARAEIAVAECPQRLQCRVAQAAYAQLGADPAAYGNYDRANRPADGLAIRYLVIHDTEYPHDPAIGLFQDPRSRVSAHYLVRSADGQVTQLVRTGDVAWHAGNWWINSHAIGIEIEGYAVQGATWYTAPVLRSLARLVRWLADRFHIPLDRAHVIGHDEVPGPTASRQAAMHWDPGPFFDWSRLLKAARAPTSGRGREDGRIVTIAPRFADNRPVVTSCDPPPCRTLPAQGANFVELHSGPSADSPLSGDPFLGPGTTRADDWGSKAMAGRSFARAGRSGDWTAIWYGGQPAWFRDPDGDASRTGRGLLITPKAGLAAIPVYGRAYPAAVSTDTLGYTIPGGQAYVAYDLVGADYYAASVFNAPETYSVIRPPGDERFYEISFNHRLAFVHEADVDVVPEDD